MMTFQNNKRKSGFPTNEYQKPILIVAFVPIVVLTAVFLGLLLLFQEELTKVILSNSAAKSIQLLNQWVLIGVLALSATFFGLIFWAHKVSLNLVGAFERILRELDQIIQGKGKKPIKARVHDKLANDLLERINVLIESYQGKNK